MRLLHLAPAGRSAYLARAFGQAGHVVEVAGDLAELLLAVKGGPYDALLLEGAGPADIPLPILDGAGSAVVAVLVDKAAAAERVRMLREGADACFTRPVSFMELEARLVALTRLAQRGGGDPDGLVLDPAIRSARMGDRHLMLPMREFALLDHLAARVGEVVSAQQLLEQVWGEVEGGGEGRVRTVMTRLRRRLIATFGLPMVETVAGYGYRLNPKMKLSSSV